MKSKIFTYVLFFLFIPSMIFANTQFFEEGLNLFKNKKFDEAKFKFEQDLVQNPKSEMSYLYLSKIYKNFKNIIDPQVKIKFNQDVKLDGVKRKKLDTSLATRNGWKAEMNFSKLLVKTIENFRDF